MNKYLKYITLSAVAVSLMPLAACSDDEVDPYDINYIYLYQPDETFASVEYKANGSFLGDFNDPLSLVPVRLTKPAPSNIAVQIAIDESLVADYNEANGTDYTFLTGASIVNPNMTIAQGKYITDDNIQISFADRSGFMTEAENLILPIVIKSATGGVTISESSRVFLTFNSTYRANKVTLDAPYLIVDTSLTDWQSAYHNYTIEGFATAEWPADAIISMWVENDPSLVDSYNAENGTSFKKLSASIATNSQFIIPAGKQSVDLPLILEDYSGIANGEEYLVPLKVTSFTGEGAALVNNVVYFQVINTPPTYSVATSAADLGLGDALSPDSSWKMYSTIAGFDHYGETTTECSFLVTDPGAGFFGWDEGNSLTIDFGSAISVDGFSIRFYAWYYGVKSFTAVETSKDAEKWDTWNLEGTFPQQTPTIACKFPKAVSCRYIRIGMGDAAYGSYYGSYATAFFVY